MRRKKIISSGALKRIEHGFKSFAAKVVSPFFDKPQPRDAPLHPGSVERVLFLRHEKIGDMVISLPVFETLRNSYPHIKMSVFASPRNRDVIKADEKLDTIYLYRKQVFKDWETIRRIRKRKYDLVVDMICGDSVTSLFLSQLVAPGATRVAVGKTTFAKYYHYHYPVNLSMGEHIIDLTLRVLRCLGLTEDSYSYHAPMSLSASAKSVANEFLANGDNDERWKDDESKIIGVNISAGAPNRDWGAKNYIELLRLLSTDIRSHRLIVFSVPWERSIAQRIVSDSSADIELIPPALGLEEVSALISKLDLLITPDTSLIHIARSFNVPVVGLYSNHTRNFNQWRAYGQTLGLIQGRADDDIHDILPARVLAETTAMFKAISQEAITREK